MYLWIYCCLEFLKILYNFPAAIAKYLRNEHLKGVHEMENQNIARIKIQN